MDEDLKMMILQTAIESLRTPFIQGLTFKKFNLLHRKQLRNVQMRGTLLMDLQSLRQIRFPGKECTGCLLRQLLKRAPRNVDIAIPAYGSVLYTQGLSVRTVLLQWVPLYRKGILFVQISEE